MAVIDRDAAVLGPVQQTSQGCDCFLGPSEVGLQSGQMVGDHPVAGLDVETLEHNLDVLEWHLQVAEAADDLRRDDLFWGVAPVSAVYVHVDRLQQAELVVVTKHLHAQVRGPGEVADGEGGDHHPKSRSPQWNLPQWEGQAANPPLTLPLRERRGCYQAAGRNRSRPND